MGKQSFWSDVYLEPKRNYKFLLLLGGIPFWIIKKTSKPSLSISETEHKYLNGTFYYPGKPTWEKLNVTLIDPINPDASKTLENIIIASGYQFPSNPNDVTTFSKAKAVGALGRVEIQMIGPDDSTPVERWIMHNAWVTSVKYGELAYDNEDMTEISLEIRFDFAEIITPDPGIPPANA